MVKWDEAVTSLCERFGVRVRYQQTWQSAQATLELTLTGTLPCDASPHTEARRVPNQQQTNIARVAEMSQITMSARLGQTSRRR